MEEILNPVWNLSVLQEIPCIPSGLCAFIFHKFLKNIFNIFNLIELVIVSASALCYTENDTVSFYSKSGCHFILFYILPLRFKQVCLTPQKSKVT